MRVPQQPGADDLLSSNTSFDPGDDRNRPSKSVPPQKSTTATAGPGALPITDPASTVASEDMSSRQLKFHFSPNMNPLLFPAAEDLPEGTDAWAFAKGYTSVTPLRAEYAGLGEGGCGFGSEQGKGEIEGQLWA
jgi:tubulin--tyrosine ligase